MIVGIVGSRRRKSDKDFGKIVARLSQLERETGREIKKIVTGDCDEGGDKFAREIADMFGWECEVKYKLDPAGNRWINAKISGWVTYWEFTKMCYNRNEEVAKEPLDYLLPLVAPDRTGGTENTIKHFKRHHKDWKEKLIIL